LCPGVKLSIRVEARVKVIDPGDIIFRELLEDGTLRKPEDVEGVVVFAMSVRSTRSYIRSIREC